MEHDGTIVSNLKPICQNYDSSMWTKIWRTFYEKSQLKKGIILYMIQKKNYNIHLITY